MTLLTGGSDLLWLLAETIGFETVLQTGGGENILLYNTLATLGFFGGLYAMYRGKNTYQQYTLVKNTGQEKIRSIALGRTELIGGVSPAGECPSKPFEDEDCVYASWRVAEYTPSRDEDEDKSWNTKAVGSYGTEFYLESENGRQVLVDDPTEATVTLSNDSRERAYVGSNESPSERIQQFCKSQDISPTSRWRRRYTQDVLVPGETAYVLGQAVEREEPVGPNNEDRIKITQDDATGTFVISDKPETDLQEHYRNWSLYYLGGGLALSAYTLWAWFVNAGDGGYGDAITATIIGLVILAVIYYKRERFATEFEKFKGEFG